MLTGRNSYKATAPAAPPMDLNRGEPTPRAALLVGGVTIACWVAAAIGAWVATLFGPHGYERLGDIGLGRGVGATLGALMALTGLWIGFDFARLTRRGWVSYQDRLDEWHAITATSWEAQGGQVVEEQSNEWELRADKPDEVLWFIVAMHRAIHEGREAPWALRRVCDEGVWLGNRKIDINTNQARQMADNLATMGLIAGRTERHPGRWVPQNLDDAVEVFVRNGKKVL
jgi:hypothetical protein